ncbi:MAG: PilZ domain-containing protein [Leptospiraceae bacterium]|nr:PilZ domain-containing protein [Leptospiraceae bacterium]MCP5512260.1 PilZ domain-containing protein [Leptospiraceae bacterium]
MFKAIFPVSFSKLPLPIILIGVFYLLNPVISYLATAYVSGIPFWEFTSLVKLFSVRALGLNLVGFVLGVGILGVKRWGYFLFLFFNFLLILHGFYLLISFGFTQQFIWNLFVTIFPFVLNLYFLNREISTPYLTLIPRGFRKKWRIEVPLTGKVLVEGGSTSYSLKSMDISPTGILAKVDGMILPESKVIITLDLDEEWSVDAEMVRIENGNYGFKFLYLSTDPRFKVLDKFLSTKLLPRFTTRRHVKIIGESGSVENSEIINISERGFFFTSTNPYSISQEISFDFSLFGMNFSSKGAISWENKEGKFEKPRGYGVSFKDLDKNFVFQIALYVFSLIHGIRRQRDR